jgi:hypothetical protein
MNIFFLDESPKLSAIYHNDRHVIKMILEGCQLLSTAHHLTGSTAPYKPTHVNHGCAKWARHSIQNYIWLSKLTIELCNEYTFRWNKIHKSTEIARWLDNNVIKVPNYSFTTPYLAFGDHYNDCYDADPIIAYRNYYRKFKKHLAKWTKRTIPCWYFI